jgi:hypothetical protein
MLYVLLILLCFGMYVGVLLLQDGGAEAMFTGG